MIVILAAGLVNVVGQFAILWYLDRVLVPPGIVLHRAIPRKRAITIHNDNDSVSG